jgi:hypothetical protein
MLLSDLDQFILPIYMSLLSYGYQGGNSEKSLQQVAALKGAVSQADEELVAQLLRTHNWRHRITASWIAGIKNWPQFGDEIGALMLESELVYAGRGYAFAFACFKDDNSVMHLKKYLDFYLAQPDLWYDQGDAISSLMWIDSQAGTSHSASYLVPTGMWDAFVADKLPHWDIEEARVRFFRAMEFCRDTYATADL